ncbi:MAG: serine/threonine protein kinase [Myxococcales bacterium]|nr:serine/threonine protein kinase [Myxococcales bacterium]
MQLLDGRYMVDIRIGQGGAATVYAATDADGNDVALKIMTAAHAEIPTSRQRFHNEVALAQSLADHPQVVTPYEMGELPELDGRPYIAMPLVKGKSLLLLLGRLPVLDALRLIRDLAELVADVHERGIVHRDVKPSNVLVDARGVALLADFGIALLGDEPDLRTTRMGVTMGTVGYMAPEQRVDARSVGPAADLYAAGSMLYVLLTRQNPTDLFAVDREDHPRMARVPGPLRTPILRSVRYQADQRYADAREMAASLAACEPALRAMAAHPPPSVPAHLGGAALLPATHEPTPETPLAALTWLDGQTPGPPIVRAVAAPTPRRRWPYAALGVVALVSLVGFGWRATQAPPTSEPIPPTAPMPPEPPLDIVPEPPPEPVVQPEPEPVVAASVPARPKPKPPPVAAEAPLGRWRGSHGGVRIELVLGGNRATPSGTVRTFGLTGSPQPPVPVSGSYDAATRTLIVAEAPDHEPYATYELTLSEDGATLDGRMTTSNGRMGTVAFRR